MNHNFNRLFISDRALGGWQVFVDENPNNPLGDLKAKLTQDNSPAAPHIEAVGVSSLVGPRNARICQQDGKNSCDPKATNPSDSGYNKYLVRGQDAGFLSNAKVPLQSRAPGYATDEDVWRAVANDPSLAVMDANMLATGGGFGGEGFVTGVDEQSQEMQPVKLSLMDARTRKAQDVTAIGIIELGASGTYTGLHVRESVVVSVYGKPDLRRFFIKTTPGSDNMQVAHDIESTLLTTGAQAKSLRHEIDQQSATFNGFFYLMQGFMGLGLFVGVAAVGVIAFRTVVERRQQIGMLRAIGYTKNMIGLTFLIESSFIAFMGVVSGVVFALILARQLIVQEFANQGVTTFSVPWPQVIVISSLAFGFALLMTLIPSRQAASIPIAEALRYE
jgi:putative ABC transport system permease protein